jgi:hypothetical protein
MSGGHFDYNQYRIQTIADQIQDIIDLNHSTELDQYGETVGYEFPDEVIDRFKEAVNALRVAQIYAHRVDWFVSGDDGEKSFLERLDSDLKQHALDQLAVLDEDTQLS